MWIISIYLIITTSTALYLCVANKKKQDELNGPLIDKVNALLPQTQCRECGYAGCRPYAVAIVRNQAGINRCVPGDVQTMRALAKLTGNPTLPVIKAAAVKACAVIDEAYCIGCVKCIRACPVDAIVGAARQMHSVIPDYCTGCGLCIAPCPVDCITLRPL